MPASDARCAQLEGQLGRSFSAAREAEVEFGRAIPVAHCPHFLTEAQAPNTLPETLDATLFIPYTESAREHLEPIRFHADISNVNRCVGTMLGSQVTARHPEGLPQARSRLIVQARAA